MMVANELRQIQDAVTWAGEEGVRMVLLGGRDAGYVAPLLAQRQIPVLLSSVLGVAEPRVGAVRQRVLAARRLHQAGVRVGIAGAPARSTRTGCRTRPAPPLRTACPPTRRSAP
jgi:hypothetical protein